jgi:TnpA family transposase
MSSDGQRFPMRGKSLTARALSRYFVDEGISQYTHVSDQHSTYGTKVIPVTDREAVYVLDEILGNETDLPITEHAPGTHVRGHLDSRRARRTRPAGRSTHF